MWSAALLAVLLVAPVRAGKESGDEEITLPDLIKKNLEKIPELHPDKGVKIDSATFSRGVIKIVGAVKTVEQREQLEKALETMRPEIQSTLDIKVRAFDLSKVAGPKKEKPKKEKPKKEKPQRLPPPLSEKPKEDEKEKEGKVAPPAPGAIEGEIVWDSRWESGPVGWGQPHGFNPYAPAFPFAAPPPPPPPPFPPFPLYPPLIGYGPYYNPSFALPAMGIPGPFYHPW
jgi:hypothetical protein